jgi:hypothetical protein
MLKRFADVIREELRRVNHDPGETLEIIPKDENYQVRGTPRRFSWFTTEERHLRVVVFRDSMPA